MTGRIRRNATLELAARHNPITRSRRAAPQNRGRPTTIAAEAGGRQRV